LVDGTIRVTGTAGPYDTFKAANFSPAEQADPLISGVSADPDRDGLSNILEFLTSSLPQDASSGGVANLPAISAAGNSLFLTFTANTANLAAVDLVGEVGTDLSSWPDTMTALTPVVNPNGTTTLKFELPLSPQVRRFAHLKVSLK
jgi:hypothetical protein